MMRTAGAPSDHELPAVPAATWARRHLVSGPTLHLLGRDTNPPADGGSPKKKPESDLTEPAASLLLDRYEIDCITRELDRFLLRASMEASSAAKKPGGGDGGRVSRGRRAAFPEVRGFRGFLVRQAVAFCGSGEVSDVVAAAVCGGSRDRGSAAGRGMPYLCN
ncbi:hypothetical protein KSP40_PGU006672 [Platanthera guangdongensis]|uniref:Uncharacterized protein n=1 Tax=Platanthera guangdongensis TaxID=2320717 RepID=A0ABR2LEG2_9ASPA